MQQSQNLTNNGMHASTQRWHRPPGRWQQPQAMAGNCLSLRRTAAEFFSCSIPLVPPPLCWCQGFVNLCHCAFKGCQSQRSLLLSSPMPPMVQTRFGMIRCVGLGRVVPPASGRCGAALSLRKRLSRHPGFGVRLTEAAVSTQKVAITSGRSGHSLLLPWQPLLTPSFLRKRCH